MEGAIVQLPRDLVGDLFRLIDDLVRVVFHLVEQVAQMLWLLGSLGKRLIKELTNHLADI